MRHAEDRALVALEVLLEPIDRLGVEVVGRLVQQQDIRCLEQQSAEGYPSTLTT